MGAFVLSLPTSEVLMCQKKKLSYLRPVPHDIRPMLPLQVVPCLESGASRGASFHWLKEIGWLQQWQGRRNAAGSKSALANTLTFGLFADFFTEQYFIRAKKSPTPAAA